MFSSSFLYSWSNVCHWLKIKFCLSNKIWLLLQVNFWPCIIALQSDLNFKWLSDSIRGFVISIWNHSQPIRAYQNRSETISSYHLLSDASRTNHILSDASTCYHNQSDANQMLAEPIRCVVWLDASVSPRPLLKPTRKGRKKGRGRSKPRPVDPLIRT